MSGCLAHIAAPNTCCCGTFLLWCYIIQSGRAIPGQRPEMRLFSDCSDTSELQGVDFFSFSFNLQLWVRLDSLCCLRRTLSLCACVCVCLLEVSVRVLLGVRLCSLCLIREKKLGHDVCKGGCSNYGQLCSPNALPYCTLNFHQPDIPDILQNAPSLVASSGVIRRYLLML